jgi:hypothetical protein
MPPAGPTSRSPRREHRETRYPFTGKVRLLVPFDPWRLLLTVRAVNLSSSGILTYCAHEDGRAAGAFGDWPDLLSEGDPYDLQIEHQSDHLPAPYLRARLARRVKHGGGFELAFAFEAPDADLLGLLHETAAAGRPTS